MIFSEVRALCGAWHKDTSVRIWAGRLRRCVQALIAAMVLTLAFAQAATAEISLNPPNGTILPDAQVGVSYSIDITFAGGNQPPAEYEQDSFGIPPGLTLERTGPDRLTLHGTPTRAGSYSVYVQLYYQDDGDDFGEADYTLKILPEPLSITGVAPNSGARVGRTSVTLTGTGFAADASVSIGGTPATITSVSSTEIKLITPANPEGTVDVVVTSGGKTATAAGAFTYSKMPVINALLPAGGPLTGGTPVTITGVDFNPLAADLNVTIGGQQATISVREVDRLRVTTPPGSAGAAVVVVTSDGAEATSTFTYAGPPVLSPASGNLPDAQEGKPYRFDFAVTGGFGDFSSAGVSGVEGLSLIQTDTGLALVGTPTNSGTFTVTLNGRDDVGTLQGTFTLSVAPRRPVVTSVSPNSGSVYGGTEVRIEGQGFRLGGRLFIGGSSATITRIDNGTSITAITPPSQMDLARTIDVWFSNPSTGDESEITAASKFTYVAPPPVVASVEPNSGPIAGGGQVIIRGSEFRNATGVLFGGRPATTIQRISRDELRVTLPAGSVGPVDVIVNADGGSSAPVAAGRFTYVAPLTVATVNPPSGLLEGGTAVTITGSGFNAASAVSFGGVAATNFSVVNDTQISAIAPAGARVGLVDVAVTRPGETAQLAGAFEYFVPLEVAPGGGDLYTAVADEPYSYSIIASGGDGTYVFDTSAIPTQLHASVQGGVLTLSGMFNAAAEYDFDIEVASGNQSLLGTFRISVVQAQDDPEIVWVTPSGSSEGGTVITIGGANFFAPMTVTVGGVPATNVRVVSEQEITATAPAGPVGPADVTVTRAGRSATSTDDFSYVAPPTITGIAPARDVIGGGARVVIRGTGLLDVVSVTFGGTQADFDADSDEQITATVPAVASAGVVDVTVMTLGGIVNFAGAASKFTYIGPPAITAIHPAASAISGGAEATITGTSFIDVTGVSFDGIAAASFTRDSDSQITATVPAGNRAGVVNVEVTAFGGASAAGVTSRFTYVDQPAITAIAPALGSTLGGTSVTITGTGFSGASGVSLGGVAATSINVVSDTQITAITAAAGSAGAVDVEVSGLAGTGTLAGGFTYMAPPAITALDAAMGPVAGSGVVKITGTGFNGASKVSFGGLNALSFTVVNDTLINATTPAWPAGPVDVVVTTLYGTSATGAASTYTYVGPVSMSAIDPAAGPLAGGTATTITGTGFTGVNRVSFNGVVATDIVVDSDTQIRAITPAGVSGAAEVTIIGPGGSAIGRGFIYIGPATIAAIDPDSGSTLGGTVVRITGTGLTTASSVSFGGIAATNVTVTSDTQITATAPAGSAGVVDVAVTTLAGTTALADSFTYVAPPVVTAISPALVPSFPGWAVTITGTGFRDVSAVTFGGIDAQSFTILNDTSISAVTPAGGTGIVDVAVTTPGGTSATNAATKLTYISAPTIAAVAPDAGPLAGGTSVTITGTGLSHVDAVTFAGTAATSFTAESDTRITAIAPAGAAGAVDITVESLGGLATLTSAFTYLPAPGVTAINPGSGPTAGGTTVTITGTGFTPASSVSFGGIAATNVTVNNDTQITAITPANSAGVVDVAVTTLAGTTALADSFTYVAPPVVTAISPALVPSFPGWAVTITGMGFRDVSAVTFGGIDAQSFTVLNDTSISAVTPAGGTGIVDVAVTTPGGTSAANAATKLTYISAPTIAAVAPDAGPLAGGTSVTITGTGLSHVDAVTFAGTAATSFTAESDTRITAIAPAGAAGVVDITVESLGGQATQTSAFTYLPAPGVTAINPGSGPTAGGTTVTITGTGFTLASSVSFGGIAATNVTVDNDTQVTATAPAGSAGVVDVAVTTPGGTATLPSAFAYIEPLAISPASGALPGVYANQPATLTFTASGGDGNYTWSTTNLPAGLGVASASSNTLTLTGSLAAAGPYAFQVGIADGSGNEVENNYDLEVLPAPTIASVSPDIGPNTGGTAVTITGTAFLAPVSVKFGAVDATNVTLVNATTITATTPAAAVGPVDVTVTSGGLTTVLADGYTFVTPPLGLGPDLAELPGIYGEPLSYRFVGTGGTAPYSYTIAGGPYPGLIFVDDTLSGAPLFTGSASVQVTVTDVHGFTLSRLYELIVAPPVAPVVANATGSMASTDTSLALDLSDKVTGFATSLALASTPSHGTASVAGYVVTYTPQAGFRGTDSFTYTASGPGGTSVPATVTITVSAVEIAISPNTLPNPVAGSPYGQVLTASGGTAPYSFEVDGDLPGGISLGADGVFSGAPTETGTFNFTIKVRDQNGSVGAHAYTIEVRAGLPVALSRSVPLLAGTTATVNLADGGTGGPFTGATIVTAPPAGTGTAGISGTELVFTADASASGAVVVGYTLSNRWGVSPPATITFVVQARPDPAKDADVVGLVNAQTVAADRLVSGQIDNFRQRLEQLHDEDSRQAGSFDVHLGLPESPMMSYAQSIFSPASGAVLEALNLPGKEPSNLSFWTGGYVNFGSRSGNGIDINHTMVGVSGGMDYRFTTDFVGGIGLGYGRDVTDIGSQGSESTAQSISAAIYGSYSPLPNLYLDGLLGYSLLDFASGRYVTSTGDFADGVRNGSQVFGSLVLGYEHRDGGFLLSPYGGLDAAWSQLDGFSETGAGPYNLAYDQMAASTLAGIVGLRFAYVLPTDWGTLKPRGQIEYSHDFADSASTRLGYADQPGSFPYEVDGGDKSRDELTLGLGLDANISGGWQVGVDYRTAIELNDNSAVNHSIAVKLGGKF